MSLEEHNAKTIRAAGEVHTGGFAFHQNAQPGLLELRACDLVEARMRHIETRVDVRHQRMTPVDHAVREHAPSLEAEVFAFLRVAELELRMRGEARADGGCDIGVSPVNHLDQRLPERLLRGGRLGGGGGAGYERLRA